MVAVTSKLKRKRPKGEWLCWTRPALGCIAKFSVHAHIAEHRLSQEHDSNDNANAIMAHAYNCSIILYQIHLKSLTSRMSLLTLTLTLTPETETTNLPILKCFLFLIWARRFGQAKKQTDRPGTGGMQI